MRNFLSQLRNASLGISRLSGRQRLVVELISGLLVFIGLATLLSFIASINADLGIREALNQPAGETGDDSPSLVLAFLDSFGIVMPTLIITLSIALIGLGLWLRTLKINTAHWAQFAFAWLVIGLGAVAILNFFTNGHDTGALMTALPVGLMAAPPAIAWVWLQRNAEEVFVDQEALGAQQTRTAWYLLIPTMAVFVFVAARPLEQTFINSLTDKRFASDRVPHFVGFENYATLMDFRVDTVECRRDEETGECQRSRDGSLLWETIDRELLKDGYRTAWHLNLPFTDQARSLAISGQDRDWLESMWTTLQFVVGSVFLELIIGLFIALTVNSSFKGRGFMRAVMLVPWAIPTVISARLWELMLKDTSAGIVNRMLMDIGILERPEAWLVQANLQVPSAIMVDVWKTSPFMALLLLAGLQTIPPDLYDAAAVDGANRLRQFLNITLPLLRPTIAVALVFRTLDALRVFDLFNVLYGRQQLTMATYNYEMLVNNQADGYASTIGVIIFVLIFIFAVIYVRILGIETE